MAFRFKLQTVLRLREIAEQREERAVEESLHRMTQQRQHLADLAAHREWVLQECETDLRLKISAAELSLTQGQLQALAEQEASGKKHLTHLEEQHQAQMKMYEAAHRNREVLSRMRKQHLDEFQHGQLRRQQMEMDDIFSCRRKPA